MLVPGAKVFRALFAGLLFLCACEPEPTPLPSVLPTTQPMQGVDANATLASLRYGITSYLLAHLSEADRRLISASAEIISSDSELNPVELGTRYDVIVAQGDPFNGTFAPVPMRISVLINTSLSPLDDSALADILRRALKLHELESTFSPTSFPPTPTPTPNVPYEPEKLRAELANAGYPDGFDLTLYSPFTTDLAITDFIMRILVLYGIEARLVAPGEPAHLTLTTAPLDPNADAVVLYTLPISYSAVAGLNITFTPSGIPIASR